MEPLLDSLEIITYKRRIPDVFLGYCLLMNGENEKAQWHFENAAKRVKNEIETINSPFTQSYTAHLYLAACYSCLDDYEKAIKYFKMITNRKYFSKTLSTHIKEFEGFNNIRNKPEFIQVTKYINSEYQKEHDRVEKLLIREGIIQ